MASVVDICNSALNQIGASNIIALTEDSKAARICNQRYDFIRDSVFRAHPWNSLTTRVSLAPDSAAPVFEFTKQFTLPTDPFCLRVLGLSDANILYRVEGRKLLCNESTIEMIYVGRVTDINEYDTLLIETLAAALAADLAYPLVGSQALGSNMYRLYQTKLTEARFVDATEDNQINTSVVTESRQVAADTFINSRF
tara:strand:- start:3257 stop:3847 length:591 start_codon:yes stop_codon:yes gene_type:complete